MDILFFGVQKWAHSDLNQLPGRVKRSDLVQSGRDTSPDVVGGLKRGPGVIYHGNITLGTSQKHSFGAHLGSFGPLEASRGQTRQTMVESKLCMAYWRRLEESCGPGKDESR